MAGVIFLANASIALQVAWACVYVVLNAAYWVVAALPARLHWDLSAFQARTIPFEGGGPTEGHATFTQTLWTVIAITRRSRWARDFDIAPNSRWWDEWLNEAEAVVDEWGEQTGKDGTLLLPTRWNAPGRLSELMERAQQQQETEKQV